MTADMPQKIHEGRNVKRFREMLGLKQDALAYQLGEEWTQKKVSQLEQKETIDADILEQVSKALNIPVEAFRNLSDEGAVNLISNTFSDHAVSIGVGYATNYSPTFNPLDKVVELYERLLASEREKVEILKESKG